MENIVEYFIRNAQKYPEQVAIIEEDNQITYKQLYQKVLENVSYLRKKGIKSGDRILVFVPMSINLYCKIIAVFYIGAVAVFVDEWANIKRLKQACKIADCKAILAPSLFLFLSRFIPVINKIPIRLRATYKMPENDEQQTTMWKTTDNAPALITFTTGSTGLPKAANRTHQFLEQQFDALRKEVKPHEKDIDMVTLPVVLLLNLGVGATSVIGKVSHNRFRKFSPERFAHLIIKEKINRITCSPFFVIEIARYALKNNLKIPGVKRIFTGGAPVFASEAKLLTAAFSNAKIEILYGSTEAEPMSKIDANELKNSNEKNGLPVGEIYSGAEIRIIKIDNRPIKITTESDWQEYILDDSKIGEIIVSGKHILKEYFRSSKEFERNKIIDGDVIWHRTGDAGYRKNKQLFLTGRCKTMIKHKGKYISPFLIENKLKNIKAVKNGTILQMNNKIILAVEKQKGSNNNEIETALKNTRLLYDKLMVVKNISKDKRHNSKIDYDKLQQQLKNKI